MRYVTPLAVPRAMAVTGGITLAAAASMADALAMDLAGTPVEAVRISHSSGALDVPVGQENGRVALGGMLRTARRMISARVSVQASASVARSAA